MRRNSKTGRRYTAEQKQSIMRDWQARRGTVSKSKFCTEHDITVASLVKWIGDIKPEVAAPSTVVSLPLALPLPETDPARLIAEIRGLQTRLAQLKDQLAPLLVEKALVEA